MKVLVFLFFTIASVRCFSPSSVNVGRHSIQANVVVKDESNELLLASDSETSRRNFFTLSGSTMLAASSLLLKPNPSSAVDYSKSKVLVLGGSGFVGSQVCKQLQDLGVEYIATSRDGRGGSKALDFTNSEINVSTEVENLARGYTAVISCIGAIGTQNDEVVNSGTGLAALGAKAAGVQNFVYISVAPEVRESAKSVSFLADYMNGKQFSEGSIKSSNFGSYTLIEPTFIYGGDKFSINPPRVADGYGQFVEAVLSSSPFRAAASISPGIIGVALEPPVKVSAVAGAAVAGALGLTQSNTLDTYDKINEASKLI